MRKGSDVIGKAIVAFDTGSKVSRVKDLIFDQDSNQILALLVEEGGWFNSPKILPLDAIQAIGLDAVITPSRNAIISADRVPDVKRILEYNNILQGTHILTTDGRNLGRMIDLYFDETTGFVEGYEVTGGLFADAYSGRSFVPAPKTFKIGRHAAFVPPEVANLMEEQVGGIKAAMQTAGEKIGTATQEAGRLAATSVTNTVVNPAEQKEFAVGRVARQDVVDPNGTPIIKKGQTITAMEAQVAENMGVMDQLYRAAGGRVRDHIAANMQGLAANYSVEQARGRRVQVGVRTRDGLIVAAPGQIVTDSVIERAKAYHLEPELLSAVGLTPTEATRAHANDRMSRVGDRVQSGSQDVGSQLKSGAQSFWEQLKDRATDLQERSARKLQEQRIKVALGRPVTRVILDQNDDVILNVGELVTHQAIATARQADVLDILLNSIYTQPPKLSNEELRAPEMGSASLEAEMRTEAQMRA